MVLGPLAMSIGKGSALVFVQRPVSLIPILVAVLVLQRLAKRWSARRLPARKQAECE